MSVEKGPLGSLPSGFLSEVETMKETPSKPVLSDLDDCYSFECGCEARCLESLEFQGWSLSFCRQHSGHSMPLAIWRLDFLRQVKQLRKQKQAQHPAVKRAPRSFAEMSVKGGFEL